MTDILFGQAYYLRFDPKLAATHQPYPPLGTLYAASYVRARGYSVALFDAMLAQSEDEWAAALDRVAAQTRQNSAFVAAIDPISPRPTRGE